MVTIIDHPSPNHSARKAGVRVDTIVLHHTASVADDVGERNAINWLCKRSSGVSAHYVIGVNGDVYRLVPENRKAWHAGKGRLPWETCPEYDFNHRSIGIELVNPGDGKTPFTEAQYKSLEWLLPDIVNRHRGLGVFADGGHAQTQPVSDNMRPIWILGHRDIAPGRKTDPADNFGWGRVRKALSGGMA